MTPKDIKDWNELGCVGRSLLKIANTNGNPITRDKFWKKFGHELYNEKFNAAVGFLGLSIKTRTKDYALVSKEFNPDKPNVLVFSEIDLNPGNTNSFRHCSVLTRIDKTGFCLWIPAQDGTEAEKPFTEADWFAKQCSGLVLG